MSIVLARIAKQPRPTPNSDYAFERSDGQGEPVAN